MHKAYSLQFETMAAKTESLTRELADVTATIGRQGGTVVPAPLDEFDKLYDQQISLDVASTVASDLATRRMSRQLSQMTGLSVRRVSIRGTREQPFWKVSLSREGADWDTGNAEGRRGSLRCVSPMTVC